MNKRAKVGQPVKNEDPDPVSQAATPPEAPEDTNPAGSAESKQKEKMPDFKAAIEAATAGKLLIRGQAADADLQKLVDKLLTEGSTFEDVVESARECGAQGLTIHAVRSYFLGSGKIQALRVRYMAETSESLMKGLGDDADTAEARLAKATMLTGLMNLHEGVAPVTPKDAEHDRMERAQSEPQAATFRRAERQGPASPEIYGRENTSAQSVAAESEGRDRHAAEGRRETPGRRTAGPSDAAKNSADLRIDVPDV